jgi:hypothetical protein
VKNRGRENNLTAHGLARLDSICVALLVLIFTADIHKNLSTVNNNNTFLVAVFFGAVLVRARPLPVKQFSPWVIPLKLPLNHWYR